MTAAVKAVGRGPLAKGFLAVEEYQPVSHGILPPAEQPAELEQKRGARGPVVRAHERATVKALGVVVTRDHQHFGPGAGDLGDQVRHGDLADGRVRHETVFLDLTAVLPELTRDPPA